VYIITSVYIVGIFYSSQDLIQIVKQSAPAVALSNFIVCVSIVMASAVDTR